MIKHIESATLEKTLAALRNEEEAYNINGIFDMLAVNYSPEFALFSINSTANEHTVN